MLNINFDEWNKAVKQLEASASNARYAASQTLNEAAKNARATLVQHTWPSSVTVRNRGFLSAALHTEFATKSNLSVAITDARLPGRAHLGLHADGGVKVSRGKLAIPSGNVRVGAHGVVTNQRPGNLPRKVVIGDTIFQRVGHKPRPAHFTKSPAGVHKARTARDPNLKVMFSLRPSARIKADVPFMADFTTTMSSTLRTSFMANLLRAIRPR